MRIRPHFLARSRQRCRRNASDIAKRWCFNNLKWVCTILNATMHMAQITEPYEKRLSTTPPFVAWRAVVYTEYAFVSNNKVSVVKNNATTWSSCNMHVLQCYCSRNYMCSQIAFKPIIMITLTNSLSQCQRANPETARSRYCSGTYPWITQRLLQH